MTKTARIDFQTPCYVIFYELRKTDTIFEISESNCIRKSAGSETLGQNLMEKIDMFPHGSFSVFRRFLPGQDKVAFLSHRVFSASGVWRETERVIRTLFRVH